MTTPPAPQITTLSVTGMHCPACVRRLTDALTALPHVVGVSVTLDPPLARVESTRPIPLADLSAAAGRAGGYSLSAADTPASHLTGNGGGSESRPTLPPEGPAGKLRALYPLVLILAFITAIAALTTFVRGDGHVHTFMNDFMAGFFLVFSFFKLLDLRGFADAYATYDLIAARSRAWAFAYPFVELALGVAYLVRWQPIAVNIATLALMLLGALGVLRALRRGGSIRCACLGTALNLPMTTVTLVEDVGMAAMAGVMLAIA